MKLLMLALSVILTSCTAMPEMWSAAESIATDDAITIKVDRDAFQKSTDVRILVEVRNKGPIDD
jgi:starvation-inducible outer membrane lipoprotein